MRARALIVVTSALLLAGCGGAKTTSPVPETVEGTLPTVTETTPQIEGDATAGKLVFTGAGGCGTCHAFSDAGTTGAIGPNLDESEVDLATAVDRVTNGKGVMPAFKGQLSDQQIADVSTYVVESKSG